MEPPVPLFAPPDEPRTSLELRAAAERVVASGRYLAGPEVAAFEAEFAAYCGVRECVAVANGTDALELALRAAGVTAGDRVATVANAGCYASSAIRSIGATSQYVDVDDRSLTMSSLLLERQISEVRAVIVTHLYGRLAAVEDIVRLAARKEVPVIEDCAQAHGARRAGRFAGTFGRAGCFSFYPTKNLGALGDGGAVVTSDAEWAERLRALRQYGWRVKYRVDVGGGRNSRMDEIQAAFLRSKLPRLDAWNAQRAAIAARYTRAFISLPLRLSDEAGEGVTHVFVVRSPERESLRAHLASRGITTEVHYPIPDHRQPVCDATSIETLAVTEAACREVLSLPCHPGLSDRDVARVIDGVTTFFAGVRSISGALPRETEAG